MKYKIERAIAGDGDNGWVRSDTYPDTYTGEDAGRILKSSSLNYRMVVVSEPTPGQGRTYIIEGPLNTSAGAGLSRSAFYPALYTREEAQGIVAHNEYGITSYTCRDTAPAPVKRASKPSKPSKPYRRHAAITPLELRGAIAMLQSACKHIAEDADKSIALDGYTVWSILYNARLGCERALEALVTA